MPEVIADPLLNAGVATERSSIAKICQSDSYRTHEDLEIADDGNVRHRRQFKAISKKRCGCWCCLVMGCRTIIVASLVGLLAAMYFVSVYYKKDTACSQFTQIQEWLFVNAIAWSSSLAIVLLLRIFSDPDNNLELCSKLLFGIGLLVWTILGTIWLFDHYKFKAGFGSCQIVNFCYVYFISIWGISGLLFLSLCCACCGLVIKGAR